MKKILQNRVFLAVVVLITAGAVVAYAQDPIPHTVTHAVPFSTQAPTDNWEGNKDCEETSIIMARAFLEGNTSERLPVGQVDRELAELKSWEQEHLGYNRDTGADDTARVASEAAGLKTRIIKDYSADDLKKILAEGELVLLTIDASRLGNARYPADIPFYHMVVVTGYEGDNFFVNDPGTDSGKGNIYSFGVLNYSAADWNHENQGMDFNSKVAVVVSK